MNNKELNFIKGFSKISVSKICAIKKINRSNLLNGTSKNMKEKSTIVKNEIEKELLKLYNEYYGEDINGEQKTSSL